MRLAYSSKILAPCNKALLTVATANKLVNKFFIDYGAPRVITVSNAARQGHLSRNNFEIMKYESTRHVRKVKIHHV
jgi:hypothetical protein